MSWVAGVGDDILVDLLDQVEADRPAPGQAPRVSSVNAGRFTVAASRESTLPRYRDPSIPYRTVQNLRQSHLDAPPCLNPRRAPTAKPKPKPKARSKPVSKPQRQLSASFFAPRGEAAPPELEESAAGWFYPVSEQFPKRDYQFSIVRTALKHNTLVCLPTGLGKTFIAAVVMYNYTRWFPRGKVVFMAPTKPLVSQQLMACSGITPLDSAQICEMTGKISPNKRCKEWKEKSVFFLTPQILRNDLDTGKCTAENIVCLVIDEAHNARGNYSFCSVVKKIAESTKHFRILALSATPGKDTRTVQEVLCNLLISKLEVRTNESIDVAAFTHATKTETIVVKLSAELEHVRGLFLEVLREAVSRLAKYHVLHETDPEAITKTRLLDAKRKFENGARPGIGQSEAKHIQAQLGLAIALYNCWGLLSTHGLKAFQKACSKICEPGASRTRVQLVQSPHFVAVESWLIKNDGVQSHPKMEHLKRIVGDHFEVAAREGVSSRAIVFSQWRDSCEQIAEVLGALQYVQPVQFVGQGGKGKVTQKEQSTVLAKFRAGEYNTLVATCIGEEGLDIGSVDLIVCFDAQSSPLRSVQRSGRTGRKRKGRCVILMSEGSEARNYERSKSAGKNVMKTLTEKKASLSLFENEVILVPNSFIHNVQCVDFSLGDPSAMTAIPRPSPAKSNGSKIPSTRTVADSDCDFDMDDDEAVDSFLEAIEREASQAPISPEPDVHDSPVLTTAPVIEIEEMDDFDRELEAFLEDKSASPSQRSRSDTTAVEGELKAHDISGSSYCSPVDKDMDTDVVWLSGQPPETVEHPSPCLTSPLNQMAGENLRNIEPKAASLISGMETVPPSSLVPCPGYREGDLPQPKSLSGSNWLPALSHGSASEKLSQPGFSGRPFAVHNKGPEVVLLPPSPSPIRVHSSTRARLRSVLLPPGSADSERVSELRGSSHCSPTPPKVRRRLGSGSSLHSNALSRGSVEVERVDLVDGVPRETEELVTDLLADLSQSVFQEPFARVENQVSRSSLSPASLSPLPSPVRHPTRLRKLASRSHAAPLPARRPERSCKARAIHSFHRDHKMREETSLPSHAVPAHLQEKRRLLRQHFVDSEAGCKDVYDSEDDMEDDSQEGSCSELDDFLVSQPDSSPTTAGSLTPRSPSVILFDSPLRLRSKRRLNF